MARNGRRTPTSDVRIGKDMLELVSSAMYVEPLAAYREYIQNAADSIDEARRHGLLAPDEPGRVEIEIDQASRTVVIRDNGAAPTGTEAVVRLLSLGGSVKRGTAARGFRGVGRLAALGYAQTLTFRSRAQSEPFVTEVVWDGRQLKSAMADAAVEDLATLVTSVVEVRTVPAEGRAERFFEVEVGRVVRQKGDRLLDPDGVRDYLAQVAPVPFDAEFSMAGEILEALRAAGPVGELKITINGGPPVTRPHRDSVPMGSVASEVEQVEIRSLPGLDGGLAAVAWFAHHGYHGAVPGSALVKGVRVRSGNIQIGGHAILESIFPEARFNSWTVGEVHVFDQRVVPNGRRDDFEANLHYQNIVNQLSPVGRDIARRCRTSSARRSKLRQIELAVAEVRERLVVLAQGGLSEGAHAIEVGRVGQAVSKIRRAADFEGIDDAERASMTSLADTLEAELQAVAGPDGCDPLEALDPQRRAVYHEVIGLIYECSSNRIAAKNLVDRILLRVSG